MPFRAGLPVADVEPQDLTVRTVPARFAALGNLDAAMDDRAFSLEPLLAWAERDEREGAATPPEEERESMP